MDQSGINGPSAYSDFREVWWQSRGKEMEDLQTTRTAHGNQRKRILLIDDEPGILESLEVLFDERFHIFKAKDGKEGISLLKRLQLDLVILDLTLPEIDGMHVLRWIRGQSETLPVIIITAHSTHEKAAECADSLVQGYINKPFDSLDLFERVVGILNEDSDDSADATADSGPEFANGLSSFVRESIRFIIGHYREPIRPRDVAARISVSREYLARKFKEETGFSVGDYINRLRIEKAGQLLLEKRDLKLSELSYEMGFNSDTHFLKTFKRYAGVTPTAFRKSNHLAENQDCPGNGRIGGEAHFEATSRSKSH